MGTRSDKRGSIGVRRREAMTRRGRCTFSGYGQTIGEDAFQGILCSVLLDTQLALKQDTQKLNAETLLCE